MKTMKLRAHASCQCKINIHESGGRYDRLDKPAAL